jgi:MFS family permease
VTARFVSIAICAGAGLVPGWLLGDRTGALIGAAIGTLFGLIADRFQVRTVVAAAVTAGTLTGALVGSSIVAVICLPGTCVGYEIGAAILTGLGAFVGIGIIVALATRSFDEYREGRDRPI